MSGAVWVVVAVGVFALVIVTLVVLLVGGRLRGNAPGADAPPEYVQHPRGEAIPPTGSR